MNARLTNSQDLPEITRWWEGHGHPVITEELLPMIGFIVEDGETPRACGFLYECNSASVAWVEWVTTNPDNTPMESARALKVLFGMIDFECAQTGYTVLFSTCRQPSLGRLMEKAGFQKTDEGVSHYLKIVTPKNS